MRSLSKPDNSEIAKRLWKGILFAIGSGAVLAYALYLIVAMVMNMILK